MDTLNKICYVMSEKGISQAMLCTKIGVNKSAFSDWKNGKSKSYVKHLSTIASILDVSVDYLLGKTDIKKFPTESSRDNEEVFDMFQIRLKELREIRKLSQAKLANALGVRQSTVAMWENGKNKPEFDTLTRIADFFNVSVDDLVGKTDIKKLPTESSRDDETDMLREFAELYKLLSPEKRKTMVTIMKSLLTDEE